MNPQATELLLPLVTAIIGGLVASAITYKFSLKRDQEERRRERVIAHLIEAYRNIENSAGRSHRTPEMIEKLELSLAAIFLLGSKKSAEEVNKLSKNVVVTEQRDVTALLKSLRYDLRRELGLETDDIELIFLRHPGTENATK